jgi:DNA-binding transcriptional regulator YdaS (Cro superfamily)
LALAIGAHAPDLCRWADGRRRVPVQYGALIELHTGGAVTRREMFPDSWQSIWPELVSVALNGAQLRSASPTDPI